MRIPKRSTSCDRSLGFTLVELLVVIGIIALLISVLLPALNQARESANSVKCGSNLQQMGVCINLYASENKGKFLPAYLTPVRVSPMYNGVNAIDFPTYFVYLPGMYLKENYAVMQCPSDDFFNHVTAAGFRPLLNRMFTNIKDVKYSYALNDTLPAYARPVYRPEDCGNLPTASPATIVGRYNPRNLRGLRDPTRTIYMMETGAAALLHPYVNMGVLPLGRGWKSWRFDHGKKDRMNILWCDGHVSQLMDKEFLPQKRQPQFPNATDQTGWPPDMRQYWFGAPTRNLATHNTN